MWSRNNATPMRLKVGGFTLVELMVALVIGLILIAGALKVFEGNRATYQQAQHLSELQNNMRFVTEVFARELRGATAIDYTEEVKSNRNTFVLKVISNRSEIWCGAEKGKIQAVEYYVRRSNFTPQFQLSCDPSEQPIIEGLVPGSYLMVNGYNAAGNLIFRFDKDELKIKDESNNTITSLDQAKQEELMRLEVTLEFETTPGGQQFQLKRTLKFNVTLRNRALQEYSS